jgi:CarD family transcriptional regulator
MATKKATVKKLASKKSTKTTSKKSVKQAAAKKTAKKAVKLQKKVTAKTAKKIVAKKPAPKKPTAKKAPVKKTATKATSQKARVTLQAVIKQAPKPAPKPVMALVEKKPAMHSKPVFKVTDVKGFAVGDYVVYPTHGVGRITGIEVETIGEYELKVFVIAFEKDKMTLRVPVGRAGAAGLRGISGSDDITRALTTLKGRAKIARGMWSRRAQEYEAKINSGNIVQIAEVVRDLHKNVDQSERSYSERMIYETAMHRLMGEIAAFDKVDMPTAHDRLIKVLKKQAA